jgi:hypothetical protein
VDDLRDPIEVLRPEAARDGLGDLDSLQDKLRSDGFSARVAR